MATKHDPESKKNPPAKRVVTEIAPAVRVMLDAYVNAHNEGSKRVSSPLKYTDVINLALDEFLPSQSNSSEKVTKAKEKKPEKEKKVKPEKAESPA